MTPSVYEYVMARVGGCSISPLVINCTASCFIIVLSGVFCVCVKNILESTEEDQRNVFQTSEHE